MKNLSIRTLFQIDAFGALLTASLLFFLVRKFEAFFGMPGNIASYLGMAAVVLSGYSFWCSNQNGRDMAPFLKGISLANLAYCCVTAGLLVFYFDRVTGWGIAYFSGEIVIVVALAVVEWRVASKSGEE